MSDTMIRNCVLVGRVNPSRWRRLPVRSFDKWLEDERRPMCQPDLGLDRIGRRRSIATSPDFRRGVKPGNAGLKYPPDPYTDEEVFALLDACDTIAGRVLAHHAMCWRRMRALIVLLWRSGLRISEALDLIPADLHPAEGTVIVQNGKGGKRRISGMDPFGFEQVAPWLAERIEALPPGPIFCITVGPTKGQRWCPSGVRQAMALAREVSGVTKRVAPHQLRHTHACGMAKEGVLLPHISRQLGHTNIATTSTYLAGIAPVEVINAVVARPAPARVAQAWIEGAQ